jgi:plastocyanin
MQNLKFGKLVFYSFVLAMPCFSLRAQDHAASEAGTQIRLALNLGTHKKDRLVPAVVWAEPMAGTPALPFVSHERLRLLQKNRMFIPHLQVIPVGSVVQFPNADPFFHNVFSLFDGRRFDLGLYEAGTSKSVTFSREGVSYIFCNIHPEMSAVVVALSTPLYAIADVNGSVVIHNVPPGNYRLHIWVEGVRQIDLNKLTRTTRVESHPLDLGQIAIPARDIGTTHTDKFGKAYSPDSPATY